MRTRPLPQRKTLGTEWNLRPDTERVRAGALRVGDVVMESFDHPAVVDRIGHPGGQIAVHCKYIWSEPWEPTWLLGTFNPIHLFDRALPGEY